VNLWVGICWLSQVLGAESRENSLFERSDNVIARPRRCSRDFSAFLYMTSDPQKCGIYVTFV